MGKKKKEQVKVTCVGNSGDAVVGSSWMVEYPKHNGERGRFLIELGMVQLNGRLFEEYKTNKAIIDAIPEDEIEFIITCHSNCDHVLLIPALYNKGFKGKVISTEGNKNICHSLMMDGAYILNRNSQSLEKKGYSVTPLYTEQDVQITTYNTNTYSKNEIHKINDYISIRFRSNNHIIFATQLEVFITMPSGRTRKLLYTSDIGSNKNYDYRYFLDKTDIVTKSNLSIFECTYSDVNRTYSKQDVIDERRDLLKTIKNQFKKKGKVIIPSFAQCRSQELLCFLYDNLRDDPIMEAAVVVLDGKLVHELNNMYLKSFKEEDRKYFQEVLNWDKIHFIKDYNESILMANKRDVKMIVIAGAGMANIGRILNYIKASIGRKNDLFAFIGYTAKHTIGDYIKNENIKSIKIEGLQYDKLAKVKVYKTWSSHIQADELINYFKQHNTERIVLHHGDESKYNFAEKAKDELYKIGKTTRITCADKDNLNFIV